MRRREGTRRVLAWILAAGMCMSNIPAYVFAEEKTGEMEVYMEPSEIIEMEEDVQQWLETGEADMSHEEAPEAEDTQQQEGAEDDSLFEYLGEESDNLPEFPGGDSESGDSEQGDSEPGNYELGKLGLENPELPVPELEETENLTEKDSEDPLEEIQTEVPQDMETELPTVETPEETEALTEEIITREEETEEESEEEIEEEIEEETELPGEEESEEEESGEEESMEEEDRLIEEEERETAMEERIITAEAGDWEVEIVQELLDTAAAAAGEEPATHTFVFYNGSEELDRVILKGDETLSCPETPTGSGTFIGWYTAASGGAEFTGFGESPIMNDGTTSLYARFAAETVRVTYHNPTGAVLRTDTVSRDGSYTFNPGDPMFVTAVDEGNTGWKTADGVTYSGTQTLTEDLNLYPVVEKGYWVTFDSDGGSYVEKQFVTRGGTAVAPTAPKKQGCTFQSWQKNGTNYNFSTAVNEDITLKSAWATGTANYTIAYWLENTDDDGYYFYGLKTKNGKVGSPVTFNSSTDGIVVNDSNNKQLYYYNSDKTNTSIANCGPIAADGSTVLNVYYYKWYYNLVINYVDGKTYTFRIKEGEFYCDKLLSTPGLGDINKYKYTFRPQYGVDMPDFNFGRLPSYSTIMASGTRRSGGNYYMEKFRKRNKESELYI